MANNYPHPIIAREGWFYLTLSILIAVLVGYFAGWWWSVPLWVVAVFVLQFFRDPPREIPGGPNTVVCPADGRVLLVMNTEDPYLNRPAIKVSIFMNVFNVHSNRSPVDAVVKDAWYRKGSFLNAALDKASLENERNALWLQTDTGVDITCVQIAGLVARRVLCYIKPGDRLARGQRFGFIRFGSRVDVYLPPGSRVRVELGQKVSASSTVLAEL
ncbi:MAG TPA: phosphatidylserine decarboxylase [Burkholderiales bacterium]|nr:phosphatidylserine decarboxylase [Burkholderiales bacterium]